jgi:RES domain-containing protein
MPTAWRIVKTRYAATAFDGEGARLYGGRWTSAGRAAVYTADSAALATLEVLVHLHSAAALSNYSLLQVTFADALLLRLEPDELPDDWQASPAAAALRALGDRWLDEGTFAVLQVPSAVVPSGRNFLLNPGHADFRSFTFGRPVRYRFDARLRK